MHLESRSLIKKFGSRTVVDCISVRIDKGEIVGLLGPNGAGKTTTFYMIVGLEKPTHGDVYLSDICITDYPMYRRAELGISYLTQEPSIFRKLTVTENIAAILETTKLSAAEQKHKLDALLEEFHIGHVRDRRGTELSGGERRRVEIARCLALEPQFILLDEPLNGIDLIARDQVMDLIISRAGHESALLLSSHLVEEMERFISKAIFVKDGNMIADLDVEELRVKEGLSLAEKYRQLLA